MKGKPKRQRTVTAHLCDRATGWHVITTFTVFRSGRVDGPPPSDFPTADIARRLDARRARLGALLWTRWFGAEKA